MRAFIALDMPPKIVDILKHAQKELETADARLKMVSSFHLTLKFLGGVDEHKIEHIKNALQDVSFEAFPASLTKVGVFPSPNHVRVIWVGTNPEQVCALQGDLDKALTPLGFKPERRFHPHITIARVKSIRDKEGFRQILSKIDIPPNNFTVGSFTLKKSTLTQKGPLYENMQIFNASY